MAQIDEVVDGVGSGGLVVALAHMTETDIIDDEEARTYPGLEAPQVGVVGEAGMEVLKEVDAADIAHGDALLAGTEAYSLEDVTLPRPTVASEDDVLVSVDEVEGGKL